MTATFVYVTAPSPEVAERIATALVEERLAAGVNVIPSVRSTYRWHGRVERADELVLIAKTNAARVAALAERVRALHPYQLPAIAAWPATAGLPAYLDWIVAESSPEA